MRSAPRSFVILSLTFLCLGLTYAWGQQPGAPVVPPSLPLLTRAGDIRALSAKQANLGYPVRLRAVVTYYDAARPMLFVQDQTGGIWVDVPREDLHLETGKLVEVEGVSDRGYFANQIERPKVRILGRAPLPPPLRPPYEQLALGRADSQWVEIEGIVRSAEVDPEFRNLVLAVALGAGRVVVRVPRYRESAPHELIDSKVLVRGACGGMFNEKQRLVGVIVYSPDLTSVRVTEPGPPTAEVPPIDSLGDLMRLSLRATSGHRVKVRGVVTLQQPFRSLYIRDATDSLRIETNQQTAVQPGDIVEVLGFPALGEGSQKLEDAVFRKVGQGPPPVPADIGASEVLQADKDGALVRLEGRVFDLATEGSLPALVVESGRVAFQARVLGSEAKAALARLPRGSRVRVTGICEVQWGENGSPQAFRLLVGSPAEVVLLEKAPWWNLDRARWVMGLMGVLMLATAAWVLILRRQVGAKTREIREWLRREAALTERFRDLLENAIDMVYTRDLEGNFTSWNNTAERVLGYTRAEALGMNLAQIIAPECQDVVRQALAQTMQGQPFEAAETEVITKYGTRLTVEVRGRLLYENGKPVEVQGIARNVTERKRAEKALQESESRLQAIFNSVQTGIFVIDAETHRIVDANPVALDLVEQPRDVVVGAVCHKFVCPANEGFCPVTDLGQRVDNSERVLLTATGQQRAIIKTVVPVVIAGRKHLLENFIDITARQHAEEALQESEERFRSLVENSTVGIYRTTPEGRIIMSNPALIRMLGYESLEELIARNLEEVGFEPSYPRRVFRERMERDGEVRGLEAAWTRRDGSVIFVRESARVVRADVGQELYYDGIVEDITERKRAEEALRQSEEKYRSIVLNIPEVVWTVDSEGHFAFMSPNIERLAGFTAEEVYQTGIRLFFESVHAEDQPRMKAAFVALFSSGQVYDVECRARRKNGEWIWVHDRAVGTYEKDGVRYAQGLLSDITERKQVEVAQRKAMEAAEEANRAKSEFLANMSHELRTPMNAIIGMTELALATDLNAEQRRYLDLVESSANSLLALIDTILDFSRIGAGQIELESVPFVLADAVDEALLPLSLQAYRQGLEMAYGVSPAIPSRLLGDPARLKQILLNLVGNALKFTARGEVVVRAQLEAREETAVCLHFTVADTGVGIPADKLEMILEAFTQVDGSMARRFEGAGLGLAACAELVRLMGGRIWVESQLGKGSTFHFTVRLGWLGARTAPGEEVAPSPLRGLPVLVVDGHAASREIVEDILRHHGMIPTLVEDMEGAQAAIRRAQESESPFRLALLDAPRPGGEGVSRAGQLRQTPGFAAAILMMLPPQEEWCDTPRCRELGIVGYLTKPVREAELVPTLVKALEEPASAGKGPSLMLGSAEEFGRALRILLVENDEVSRVLVTHLLEKRGHLVVVAGDGVEALETVGHANPHGFDLVLMDLEIPRMNGREAAQAIREKERHTGGRLPIIALTAQTTPGEEEACRAAGMDGYITKPFRASDLFAIIQHMAEKPPQGSGVTLTAPGARKEALPATAFDKTRFLAHLEGDDDLATEIVGMFLTECPKLMDGVCQAAAGGDPRALERAAHSLKGSVGDMAAPEAFEAARSLEQMAREGTLEGVGPALANLEGAIDRLLPELQRFQPGAG